MSTNSPARSPFASSSVPRHLLRGAIGLIALVGAFAGLGLVGPVSLTLLVVAVAALRGCPTCWILGLLETIAERRGGAARTCARR